MAQAHWQRDERSLSVFFTESFITPRYPCPQEERIGNVWGDGGKVSTLDMYSTVQVLCPHMYCKS